MFRKLFTPIMRGGRPGAVELEVVDGWQTRHSSKLVNARMPDGTVRAVRRMDETTARMIAATEARLGGVLR